MIKEEIDSLKRIANFREVKIPEYNPRRDLSGIVRRTYLGHECVCGARIFLTRALVPSHLNPTTGAYCNRSLNGLRLGNWTENVFPTCPACFNTISIALLSVGHPQVGSIVRVKAAAHYLRGGGLCPLSNTTIRLANSDLAELWRITKVTFYRGKPIVLVEE